VLRKIFGTRRNEVRGEWRRSHSDDLHDLYRSVHNMRVIKSRRTMGGACGTYGRQERCIQNFGEAT
jgi:hypothetical protein